MDDFDQDGFGDDVPEEDDEQQDQSLDLSRPSDGMSKIQQHL